MTTRIGIAGLGSIGRRHGRRLSRRPGIALALYDPAYRPDDIAEDATIADSYESLLAMDLDGMVIATPESIHVGPAVAACERGLPVLLEKPVADSSAAAHHLAEVVSATGTPVLVGYVLRHHRAFEVVESLLRAETIGTVASFSVSLGAYETLHLARNRFDARQPNRLYLDYSHEWDYLQWLLGPVARAVAVAQTVTGVERVEEPNVVDALLQLTSGVTGTVHLDYVQEGAGRVCQFIGDRGAMTVDVGRGPVDVRLNGEPFQRSYPAAEPIDVAFDRQLDHFLDVISGTVAPRVSVNDGIHAIQVGEALVRSVAQAAWVNLG